MQVQFFKTPMGKLILVKEMNCVYEITRGFKNVFVSSLERTLFRMFGCNSTKETHLKNKLIISLTLLERRLNNKDIML